MLWRLFQVLYFPISILTIFLGFALLPILLPTKYIITGGRPMDYFDFIFVTSFWPYSDEEYKCCYDKGW
jgi:hypothetical protein